MFKDYKDEIPENLGDESRVWIYQSNRKFSIDEIAKLEPMLANFCREWNSHGKAVSGFCKLFYNLFIVIFADETTVKVGGCSTDAQLRFIKHLEKVFDVTLTDRLSLAFIVKDKIEIFRLEEVNMALEDTVISPDTPYFNNTILTKKDFLDNWIIPLKDSWLKARVDSAVH